jgi:acyl-[acyl-carrier-protein]-phospholipid O-acyltransferase/long-chain-fatty-acid--[acyl-carrier-protein] ligase
MLGYYKADRPGELQPPEDRWHDTGDIVSIDADGYVRILGRMKRFAKIAGEMVSLTQVEAMAQAVWPDAIHAAVTLPEPRKGEQIVLVTTQAHPDRGALSSYAAAHGIAGLAVPAMVLPVAQVPLLGTGKIDYPAVKALAEQCATQAA